MLYYESNILILKYITKKNQQKKSNLINCIINKKEVVSTFETTSFFVRYILFMLHLLVKMVHLFKKLAHLTVSI